MASRFWIGGTGTWDATTTTHWSNTSGGTGGFSVPGSADAVIFDANSGGGTVTVNTSFTVTSVTMGAFTGTLDFAANNNDPTLQTFSNSGTGTRTLNMGSGTWTITGSSATVWNQSTSTNLTLNANTSTINFSYSGSSGTRTAGMGSLTYANITVSAGADSFSLTGTPVFTGNFSTSGFTGTFSKTTVSLTIGGNFTVGAGSTWSSTGGTLTLNTTGSCAITANGVNINQSITINGVSGTFTLSGDLNLTGSIQATLTLTNGTFNANGQNVSVPLFNSSNANTRTLNMGSGTWYITGSAATVWNLGTITGLTFNAGTSTLNFNSTGSTGTRTFFTGSTPTYNNIYVTAGSDTFTLSGALLVAGDYSSAGFTGTFNKSSAGITIGGNFVVGSGSTWSSTSGTITLTSTVPVNINTNSVGINTALTINGAGGTFTLQNNLDISGSINTALTVTSGAFIANNYNVKAGIFSSNNSNTRTINMGSGTWTFTGTGTAWNLASVTNLTLTSGAASILFTGSTVTFSGGTTTYGNVTFTGGGSCTVAGSSTFANLTYTGAGAGDGLLIAQTTITGTLTVTGSSSANKTAVQTNSAGVLKVITFGTASLTNVTWTDISLTQNGTGTWTLLEDLTLTSSTNTPILTILHGTFSTNNFNINVGNFNSTGSATRTINMGSTICTLNGASGGVIFSTTVPIFNSGTSSFIFTNNGPGAVTITPGGATVLFNTIWFNRGASTGSNVIAGNLNCNNFIDTGTAAHNITVNGSNTVTINTSWNVSGSAGNLITLTGSTPTVAAFSLINNSGGNFSSDYLNIQHSIATPVNSWLAGLNSVNNQGVAVAGSGWAFTTQGVIQSAFFAFM